MFTIIGGDGQEYGPASVEQLRTWLTSGRANLDTRARKAGEETWRRLGDFAEFAPPAGAPPLIAAGAAVDTQLGGLGARFGAAFVDGCLQVACQMPAALPTIRFMMDNMQAGTRPDPAEATRISLESAHLAYPYLAALAVLQGVLLATRSQSVGKILFGLRIVLVADGKPAGLVRAYLVRGGVPLAVLYLLQQVRLLGSVLGLVLSLVDICFIFRSDRRCVHDLIAGTKVVKS